MTSRTPRTIWMLWLQGWDQAPATVSACADSWSRLHPDWEVRRLDRNAVEDEVPWLRDHPDLSPQACSDVARTALLAHHGGVWADATVHAHRRLDAWLPRGFVAFHSPAPGRPVSSWLLASPSGGRIITTWAGAAQAYWSERGTTNDYFWLHHLFGDLVSTDPAFAKEWAEVRRIRADGPHYFAPYGRRYTGRMTRRTQARLASGRDPVYKLTHRIDPEDTSPGSAARWFAEGAGRELRGSRSLSALDRPVEAAWRRYSYHTASVRNAAKKSLHRLAERNRQVDAERARDGARAGDGSGASQHRA